MRESRMSGSVGAAGEQSPAATRRVDRQPSGGAQRRGLTARGGKCKLLRNVPSTHLPDDTLRAFRAISVFRSELLAENLGLPQQVCALKRKRPRPPLDDVDRAFRVALRAS